MQGIRSVPITLAIILAAFSTTVAAETASTEKSSDEQEGQHDWLIEHPTIQRLLKLHNETRARYGRRPLTLDTRMCLQAQAHAKKMADYGWFAHSGLPYYENIAYSQRTAAAAVRTWTYSPAHFNNMQRGTQVGFGYALRNGTPYWVAVFR
jgi:uncharacterized protein YkwD